MQMKYYKMLNENRVIAADEKICALSTDGARAMGYYPLKNGELPPDADSYTCAVITYTQEKDHIRVNFKMQGDKIQ